MFENKDGRKIDKRKETNSQFTDLSILWYNNSDLFVYKVKKFNCDLLWILTHNCNVQSTERMTNGQIQVKQGTET